MSGRELRRRCEAIVAELEIPAPFDVHVLCQRLAERRGRPIHLLPLAMSASQPCGLWVSTTDFDAIFYEEHTSQLHQEHIICHEVGHLLCAHVAAPVLDAEASLLLMPDLDPQLVQRTLGRTNYSTVEEREAEMVASLISRHASRERLACTWVAPPEHADVFDRLEHSLEHPRKDGPRGRRG